MAAEFNTSSELIKKIDELELYCFQMKNMIDNFPGDVYWKDKDGVWIGLNQRCVQSLHHMGFIKEAVEREVIGKTDYQLFSKSTADGYRKNDMTVLSQKTEITNEEKTILPSGEEITLLSIKKPIFDKKGNVTGIMGNTIDITYLKKIEAELIEAKNAAEAGNLAKDEFIRNMSHDIRTPLSGIIGISSILENEAHTPEEKEHAHMINISGEQLLSLLNSVLDIIATGSQKEKQINLSPVKIREMIHSIADLELPTIKLKNLDLRIVLPDDLPELIETDPIKIHRILLNLLGNAVKFTNQGYIEIGARLKNKDWMEFYIKDTGLGIKEDDKSNIFKKFYRGTASYQGIYKGYGVGLHIVQQYIRSLKGKISVDSLVNKGTTITTSIPIKVIKQILPMSTSSLPLGTSTKSDDSKKSNMNILLIEDNAVALKTAENILKQLGLNFQSASNGSMAIELFRNNIFHLILSDIGLPDISGLDVTRHIRKIEMEHKRLGIPVIGLTAHSVMDTEHEALESGMNQVISKPLRLEYVQDLIKKYGLQVENNSFNQKGTQISQLATPKKDLPENDNKLFEIEQFALFDEELGTNSCGGRQSLRELLDMLVTSELPIDQQNMQHAFKQQNFVEVERLAHKIKGGAVYIGTTRMKFACQYLERYWKSGERELFERLYHQAMMVIDETTSCITQWLKQ